MQQAIAKLDALADKLKVGLDVQLDAALNENDAAKRVAAATELFTLAESLGAVESLIEHPGEMTHASVAGSPLEVPDDLVRLSVGIETIDDLLADLDQALRPLPKG